MDLPTLRLLSEQVRPRRFRRGETVVRAGDAGESMFFVNAGLVAAIVGGKEVRRGLRGWGSGRRRLHAAMMCGAVFFAPPGRSLGAECCGVAAA